PLTSSQNADSITASAGADCSRSSEFGAHDRAKSLLTISEICMEVPRAGFLPLLKGAKPYVYSDAEIEVPHGNQDGSALPSQKPD
ncbi:hypothetical protein, partial [Bradyrhizobium brasilense]|uniref:hypothetical protein n=1 Tax=Bradyrhizobium brasilense TaxID=1419277 RepID=UPI001F2892FB